MITAKISEHPARVDGFWVDVMEEGDRMGKRPRIIVAREFHLEDRNGNLSRAIEFARCEMAKAIDANNHSGVAHGRADGCPYVVEQAIEAWAGEYMRWSSGKGGYPTTHRIMRALMESGLLNDGGLSQPATSPPPPAATT